MSAIHPESNLIPYLRGELSGREHDRIESHLGGCPECRAQADALAETLRLVARQVEQLPVPEWTRYRAELRSKLAARETCSRCWWHPTLVWGSMTAAAVAAVALVTLTALYRRGTGTPPMVDQLAFEDVMSRTDVGLLRNYPMVEQLDMLDNDNYEVIAHLDELTGSPETNEIQHL